MDKYVWIGHREAEIFKTNNFSLTQLLHGEVMRMVRASLHRPDHIPF